MDMMDSRVQGQGNQPTPSSPSLSHEHCDNDDSVYVYKASLTLQGKEPCSTLKDVAKTLPRDLIGMLVIEYNYMIYFTR